MLGQITLFQQKDAISIRQRVRVEIVEPTEVHYILKKLHYLKRLRMGRQINYAVFVDDKIDGVITFAHPMISVPLAGVEPDAVLEFARLYLHSNTPLVASCAIRKTIRRIKKDWMTLYPKSKTPRLIVSWSDTVLHKGTIYKASNFIWFRRVKGKQHGNSIGSNRGNRYRHNDYMHDKDCWLYPLNNKDKRIIRELLTDATSICNNE